jgi:hypothetical protein
MSCRTDYDDFGVRADGRGKDLLSPEADSHNGCPITEITNFKRITITYHIFFYLAE